MRAGVTGVLGFSMASLMVMTADATMDMTRAQGPTAPRPHSMPDRSSAGIAEVIRPGTRAEFVRGGFNGTEGVVGMPDGSALFCELDADKVIRIDLNGEFSTYLANANRPIALGYDLQGRLIATQSRDPRLAVLAPDRVTLADSFEGQPLVKPNDLVVDRKGGIYFTDPLSNPEFKFREPPPGRQSLILYLRRDGSLLKPTDAVAEPHKITLSPDEKTFYAEDGDHIVALDVELDGRLVNPRTFADIRGEELVVDDAGRVYVSTDEGITVLSPTGKSLGMIPMPIHIQNFAFTGRDRKTIYAVGSGNVYRIAMLARGIMSRQK